MQRCSVVKNLQIEPGVISDYQRLERFHYRGSKTIAFAAIFAIRPGIGVIVYSMPTSGCHLRNVAIGEMFIGLDNSSRLQLINKNIRRISRVIIEPRYRGLGLASLLVRETMPLLGVGIIESLAVMGRFNPFFVKAGMREYTASVPARCVQMTEAFSMAGVEGVDLLDARKVYEKLMMLEVKCRDFIEWQINIFLQSYGKSRLMEPGLRRIRFVLSKLSYRPGYYVWINPQYDRGGKYDKSN